MPSPNSPGEIGNVVVFATSNRGHTAEEIAEMAVRKIVSISATTPPVIRDQAIAYREELKEVLVFYFKKMALSERTTIWALMKRQGHEDVAEIIRRL